MKMKNKFIIMIISIISVILAGIFYSNSFAASTLPSGTQELYRWARNNSKNFFEIDPDEMFKEYGTDNSTLTVDANDNSYADVWRCIQSFAKGNSKVIVKTIIDIPSSGNPTVYYGVNKKQTIRGEGNQKILNNMAYFAKNFNDNITLGGNTLDGGNWLVHYYWNRKNVLNGAHHIYYPDKHNNYGGAEYNSIFSGLKEDAGKNTKVRIMILKFAYGQDRIIAASRQEEEPETAEYELRIYKQGNKYVDDPEYEDIQAMRNVKFKVTGASKGIRDFEAEVTTNRAGVATLRNLKPGKYKIEEIEIGDSEKPGDVNYGYTISSTKPKNVVIEEGQSGPTEITFDNKYPKGGIEIGKINEHGEPMEGAMFTVYSPDYGYVYEAEYQVIQYTQDVNKATKFETGIDGKVLVDGLEPGSGYVVQEVEMKYNEKGEKYYGYLANGQRRICTVKKNKVTKIGDDQIFVNENYLGNLAIKKIDKKTGEAMPNVGFTIQMTSITAPGHEDLVGKYLTKGANGEAVYSDTPVDVMTDSTGHIYIYNAWPGTYRLVETVNPYEGYADVPIVITEKGTIKKRQTTEEEHIVENERVFGDIELTKIDKESKQPMSGVGFTLQMTSGEKQGQYLSVDNKGKAVYTTEARTMYTNTSGKINISQVYAGNFRLVETVNPYPGYDVVPRVVIENGILEWGDTYHSQILVENEKKYINLSGYVWIDKISEKTSIKNSKYYENEDDSFDIRLNGIKVVLKDQNGNTVRNRDGQLMEATTSGNGEYRFENVLIEQLSNYYVEFEYNGLTYTNVPKGDNLNASNVSKAIENTATRTNFNNSFASIEGTGLNTGIAKDQNGTTRHNLTYTRQTNPTDNHVAILKNLEYEDPNANPLTIKDPGQDDFMLTATTKEAGFNIRSAYEAQKEEGKILEEIKYINLGLDIREQPDLGIVNDIKNVKLTINGYEHVYNYSKRSSSVESGDGFNVGVKFGTDYAGMKYTRPIYEADYNFQNPNDASRELEVYITYDIAIQNASSNLVTRLNTIVDYYEKDLTLRAIGKTENQGTVGDLITSYTTGSYGEYNMVTINPNMEIQNQNVEHLYVQFQVSRQKVQELINNGKLLNNVADVTSYTTFKDGQIYAGIDKDSNPGNGQIGDTTYYEDDTDYAPGLQLEVADNARQIAGKVFLDQTENRLMTGEERLGSGQYEEGEQGISGVNVKFTESATGTNYETTTNESGDFLIEGYIPGDYTLTYTWGNETYTVQDYKATTYGPSENAQTRYNTNSSDGRWYKNEAQTPRNSDAVDDWATRTAIDEEIQAKVKEENPTYEHTTMTSSTTNMKIDVEYPTISSSDTTGDKFTYRIDNIDLGIVERPRQEVELTKRVSNIKLTLANGQVIVDAQIDEEGNVTGNHEYLVFRPDTEAVAGMARIEIDQELIQGARLEVQYTLTVGNKSEIDYDSENYYKFGTKEGNIRTITPTTIVDYLDQDWPIDIATAGDGWEVKTIEDIRNDTIISEDKITQVQNVKILYSTALGNEPISPNDSRSTTLTVSKVLSNSEEIDLENEAEILKMESTGRPTPTTPGNKVPGRDNPSEPDDDPGEPITVTPSMGADRNYTMIILTIASALVILVAGIIWIIKKTLRK